MHVSDSLIVGGERRSVEDGGRPFGGGGGGKIVKIFQIPFQILARTFQNRECAPDPVLDRVLDPAPNSKTSKINTPLGLVEC